MGIVEQQKEVSRAQLHGIRAQLNPHFMFNALAGIQNLMNQDKIDDANRYLAKFARLTRNVLDQKDLISLAEESVVLEDYLQMEQLRFGFAYEVHIDKDLAIENIEIPSMLLQPFVENAIRHGIADKGKAGEVNVYFLKQNLDLVIKITDNGKGFDVGKSYEGLGLRLSKNRISLLNSIYHTTPILLVMKSDIEQTAITISLSQWL